LEISQTYGIKSKKKQTLDGINLKGYCNNPVIEVVIVTGLLLSLDPPKDTDLRTVLGVEGVVSSFSD